MADQEIAEYPNVIPHARTSSVRNVQRSGDRSRTRRIGQKCITSRPELNPTGSGGILCAKDLLQFHLRSVCARRLRLPPSRS